MKNRSKNPYDYESQEFFWWQKGYQRALPKEENIWYQQGEAAINEDEKEIPSGPYCYISHGWEETEDGKMVLKTKTCPYFYKTIDGKTGCSFLQIQEEFKGEEMLLSDQVKECGIKSD